MSYGSLRRTGLIAAGVFIAVSGFFLTVDVKTTYAAGLNEACTQDSDCNTGDTCATAGACVCRELGGLIDAKCGVTFATDLASTSEERAVRREEVLSTSDACGENPFLGFLCRGITLVLGMIVQLLGQLVTLILTILLAFAKYNGFARAAPVEVGWPIVRDVCNMFFIIVLLVSAFATIIDQAGSDLHYTKVLPKLLAMAVLINFSKTLIQLAIDFSQVVMLTFVNAFASAATGNFVNALGLTEIMQLSANAPAGSATGVNLIVSYMLAIFMLGIMISVVSIMTGFLIFRIVGLWIALILSPLAFFVTALPARLSKSLGGISGEYWSRLGSLLSGGPIIAFFLWLTLAIVQSANTGSAGEGLSQVLDFQVEGSTQVFLSEIGNAQSIASFIVGITLLMMGLDQAVKTANSLGSTVLTNFASRAKSAGTSLGRLGALAPFLAAGYAGRAGARAVDRRLDVTRRASDLGLKTIGKIPLPDSVRTPLRGTLAKGLTLRREEAQKQGAAEAAVLGNVAKFGTDEDQKLVGGTFSNSTSAFRTLGAKSGAMKANEILGTDKIRDREAKKNENKYVDQLIASGKTPEEARNGSKVLAEKDAYSDQQKFIQAQLQLAKGLGDKDKIEDLQKAIRVNPYMASDADRAKEIENLATDPEKYKDINKQDAMSGDLLTGFMLKNGWVKDAETSELKIDDTAAYTRLKESVEKSGNKALIEGLDAHELFVTNSPGLTTDEAGSLQHRKNAADDMIQTFDVSRGKNGGWIDNSSGKLQSGTRVHTKNYAAANSQLLQDREFRKSGAAGPVGDPVALARGFVGNGGSVADLFSKGDTSPTDTLMVDTVGGELEKELSTGMAALYSGDTQKANADMKFSGQTLLQLDQQGVPDKKQISLISAAATGLASPISGAVDATFIRNIERLHPQIRNALTNLVVTTKQRADSLIQANRKLSAEELKVVALSDAISKEVDDNTKNINSRILNAYRPNRDLRAP